MKITPENCHRIKQTIDGRPLQAIFFDEQCLILQVGFVVSNKLHWTNNKGFDVKDHFRLDLTPLSEPEPTPVAQAAIELIAVQKADYLKQYNASGNELELGLVVACDNITAALTDLFTARIGETIKPL